MAADEVSAHFWKVGSRGRPGESHGSVGEAEGLMPAEGSWREGEKQDRLPGEGGRSCTWEDW